MLVSVVFDPGYDDELRAVSLASVENQTLTDWEVVTDLAEATGEYVAFLDAGDSWVPDRLERLVGAGQAVRRRRARGGARQRREGRLPHARRPTSSRPGCVAQREALLGLGPVDPALPAAWLLDLLMRGDTDGRAGAERRRTPPVPGPPPRAPAAARRLAPGRAQPAPRRLGRARGADADGRADVA